ncbi:MULTISPECIES: S1C family serine protease [Oceanobacillus]|uniref:Serine protease YyxA n=1 Tax=Oceanobacillus indicireducens TaxID=1004261 RepID=A0A917XWU0_9BACI|nr:MULTISPECIES: S1C family serine protease [Oceanobacillus]GGN57599.1 putative serine protease YyxA [Oceanobacillus indicireducens]
MGYYKSRERRKLYWLTPLLLGVIIGILIVSVALPELMKANLIPQTTTDRMTETIHDGLDGQPQNTSVSVDVSTQITEVVDRVTPAVVGVTNIQKENHYWLEEGSVEAGTGSGVIYKIEDGNAYIVTNHHVVEGADQIEIVLYDDTHLDAEVVGSDLFSDLAVIRMPSDNVQEAIEIGVSGNVKVGEPAIAIGNPLGLMFSSTVTQGVISGTERTIPQDFDMDGRPDWQAEVIQTDAAINPGNSGGALINIYGQLIGINSMKINEAAVEGLGFAIPIDHALPIMQELETTGVVERPFLGVEVYSLDEIPHQEWENTLSLPSDVTGGVYIWSVQPLSPADQSGLERLDVIVELNGEPITNVIDLRKILFQEKEIGDTLTITYYRGGQLHETEATLTAQ